MWGCPILPAVSSREGWESMNLKPLVLSSPQSQSLVNRQTTHQAGRPPPRIPSPSYQRTTANPGASQSPALIETQPKQPRFRAINGQITANNMLKTAPFQCFGPPRNGHSCKITPALSGHS